MIICWDNIEKLVFLPDRGLWKAPDKQLYEEAEACPHCGEPYLFNWYKQRNQPEANRFCSRDCRKFCKGATRKKPRHFKGRKLRELRKVECPPGARLVPLTQGQHAIVDEEDYDRVMQHHWCYASGGYARNNDLGPMHRFVMNTPDHLVTDHIHGNRLDNRKTKLRNVTHEYNSQHNPDSFNQGINVGKSLVLQQMATFRQN